ncbi:MAG: fold metallo-hydrolase [Actinomycetia bacterium]|nr:fold metallo-hydrolase [Actinomycetes bacterium]
MHTQWTIGDVRITKVVEHELPIPMNGLLVDVPDGLVAKHAWLSPDFVTFGGDARLSIHGLVIEAGERRILVDTCVGHRREGLIMPAMASGFLESLAEAGYAVEDIDTVVCTHLHFDHVGWNTRLVDGEWKVTFPNARYLFGRVEWEHWSTTDGDYMNIGDTVRPVLDAGQADLVEVDHRVCAEVRLVPTPGHTPGHVSVVIESGGERAVITGDMAHHPLQFAEPDIGAPADSDSAMGAKTRRLFLADRVEDGALVIGTHFGGPTAGRIVADGDAWRMVSR